MPRPILRVPGLPFGGGLNFVLLVGTAYFANEHDKGRHERPNALCPLCWLNRITPASPASPASAGSSPADPPEHQ